MYYKSHQKERRGWVGQATQRFSCSERVSRLVIIRRQQPIIVLRNEIDRPRIPLPTLHMTIALSHLQAPFLAHGFKWSPRTGPTVICITHRQPRTGRNPRLRLVRILVERRTGVSWGVIASGRRKERRIGSRSSGIPRYRAVEEGCDVGRSIRHVTVSVVRNEFGL